METKLPTIRIALKNWPDFQAQIEDLRLECGIFGENPENSVTVIFMLRNA